MKSNKRKTSVKVLSFFLSVLTVGSLSLLAFSPASSIKQVSMRVDLASSIVNNQSNEFFSEITGIENIKALPYDFTSPQNKPDKAGYYTDGKKSCYSDSSIEVICWSEPRKKRGSTAYFSEVTIKHPSQFRKQWSNGDYNSVKKQLPSTMFANSNGVVGMSSDFYKFRRYGIIVQYGMVLCDKRCRHPLDVLVVDYEGNFQIWDDKQLSKHIADNGAEDIMLSFTFGPALVIDGKANDISASRYSNHELGEITQVVGRAGIGQLGPLHYLLCTVSNPGMTCQDIADLMAEKGCINAYNFDGGQSGTLLFNGKVYNKIAFKGVERPMCDIIYFASAE